MLEQIQKTLFVEYVNATSIGIAAAIVLLIVLLIIIIIQHGKWKKRVENLEADLVTTKDNAAKQVSEEKNRADYQIGCARRESAEALAAEQKRSADAIAAEKQRSADAMAAEQQRSADALAAERKRSEDEMTALREHIAAEKEELQGLSEKELMVRTVMALGGYAGRLDRIEAQYRGLIHNISTEMKVMLETESTIILQGFHGDIDTLKKEVKSMEDEVKTTRIAAVDGFKAEVSALRDEIKQVGDATVSAIEEADETYDDSELRALIEDVQSDVQEIKDSINDPYHYSGLRERVNEIGDDIDGIQSTVDNMASEVSSMRSDVSSIQSDIDSIQSDVSSIQYDVSDLKSSSE